MINFTQKMQCLKMGSSAYIQALEEELGKIQVFSKELPLSLELVTQAIEACKQQLSGVTTEYNLNGQSECSEQTTSMGGPVLEEFIPIKLRASTYCDEDEQYSHEQNVSKDGKNNIDERKLDWLRSVQLWNPDPPAEENVAREVPVMMELKRSGSGGGGGAFQPFHKEERTEKTSESLSKAPSSTTPVAAGSSTAATVTTGQSGGSGKREEKEGQRKQRRCWSQDLHKHFLHALQQLGGADTATPKQIKEKMNVDGLTNDEVKSHLQETFLFNQHNIQQLSNNIRGTKQGCGTCRNLRTGSETSSSCFSHINASIKKPQYKKVKLFENSNSEERANNHSEGGVHSNSPSSSSSTHTNTTSPGY